MNSCFAQVSNSQNLKTPLYLKQKNLEKMAVFTGDIKYFYCGEQLAILSLICFVSALTLNASFY